MATLQYVVNAIDGASGTFAKIALSADDLNKQIDELGKKSAMARVGLDGDVKAKASLDELNLRLTKLKTKVTDPEISVKGIGASLFGIERVSLALDRLNGQNATVDVNRSRLNRLTGGLAGAGGAGALGSLGAPASGSIGPLLGNPYVLAGGAIAGVAALPFAAAAAAGAITTILGGAFAGIAVIAASKNKQVAKSFTDLRTSAVSDIEKISKPFVGVLEAIAKQAQTTLPQVMKPLGDAIKSMAGPFQQFATTLTRTLGSPAVATAITSIGKAFGQLLTALSPDLPSIVSSIALGISRIASAVGSHAAGFASFLSFLGGVVAVGLDVIAILTRMAAWEAGQFQQHFIKPMITGFHALSDSIGTDVHTIAHVWGILTADAAATSHGIAVIWDTLWRNLVTRTQNGIADVIRFFQGLPARALAALTGLGHSLGAFAAAAFSEMLAGFQRIAGNILSWLGGFVGKIVGLVGKLLRLGSPSGVFFDIGMNMMLGLEKGIKAHAHRAASAAQGAVGALGGPTSASAGQAQAYARSRLGAYGWGSGQMGSLIALWNQESGWNRLARNPSSGAYGIPQALPPGKMGAAANPPTSSAAAQINWGLSYIKGRYGSPAGAEAHENAFHWYDRGGWLMPGATLAMNATGQPEAVVGGAPLARVEALLGRACTLLEALPARSGVAFGRELNGAARSSLR